MKAYFCSNCHRENDFEGDWWDTIRYDCACGAAVNLWAGNVFPLEAEDPPS
jgi:hypothetical protein